MNRNLFAPLLLISALFFSCSKSSQPSPKGGGNTTNIKIELVSGDNQKDTIGLQLANAITVKVTKNGVPVNGYQVLFKGSGCNEDRLDKGSTSADGTCSDYWWLAGDVGQQTMTAYAVDSQSNKIDSVKATATGLSPGPGWHISACTFPIPAFPVAFCKLSSGKLFVAINAKTYLRYSDDNGVSWNSVKSLGNAHTFEYVISTPADEIFAVAQDGNFYSTDGGQTWTSLGVQAFNTLTITGMVYTPSGKLLVSTRFNPLYISSDKGKTWTAVPPAAVTNPYSSGGEEDFGSPAEDLAGNLYLVGQEDETLFQSKDAGKTWSVINLNEMDFSFYIDQNGWFYKMVPNGIPAGIYISKDQGATYNKLISAPGNLIENMSVQSDGNFYFDGAALGLYQALSNSTTPKVVFSDSFSDWVPYIVAKNNSIIVSDRYIGLVHYYTK